MLHLNTIVALLPRDQDLAIGRTLCLRVVQPYHIFHQDQLREHSIL